MSDHENKHRCTGYSPEQRLALIEFMRGQPNLIKGKFTSNFTFKEAQRLWQQVTDLLNAIPGSKKNWQQWRKAWQDIRAKIKKKNSNERRHSGGTGGGPPLPPENKLFSWEENVLELICPTSRTGHEQTEESVAANFETCHEVLGTSEEIVVVTEDNVVLFEMDTGNQGVVDGEIVIHVGTDDLENCPQNGNGTINKDTPKSHTTSRKVTTAKCRSNPQLGTKDRRTVAQKRLQSAVTSTETLSATCTDRNRILEQYYKDKIKIVKVQANALQRIASALEVIASRRRLRYVQKRKRLNK